MSLGRITEAELPWNEEAILSKDVEQLKEFLLELIQTLQEELRQRDQITNLVVDLVGGDAVYLAGKNALGQYPNGTWRIKQVNENDVQLQKKVDDEWEKIARWIPITAHTT